MFIVSLIDNSKRVKYLSMIYGWGEVDACTKFDQSSVAMQAAISYLQAHPKNDDRYTVRVHNEGSTDIVEEMASGMLPGTETEYDALENYLSFFLNRDLTDEEMTVFDGNSVGVWSSNHNHVVSFCPKDYHDRTIWIQTMQERGFDYIDRF